MCNIICNYNATNIINTKATIALKILSFNFPIECNMIPKK